MNMRTKNPSWGFYGTWAQAKGRESAEKAYDAAAYAIGDFLRKRMERHTPEEVRNFLDSSYGRHMADEALSRSPVSSQLENRAARFLRNFAKVQRQTRDGAFDPPGEEGGLII